MVLGARNDGRASLVTADRRVFQSAVVSYTSFASANGCRRARLGASITRGVDLPIRTLAARPAGIPFRAISDNQTELELYNIWLLLIQIINCRCIVIKYMY